MLSLIVFLRARLFAKETLNGFELLLHAVIHVCLECVALCFYLNFHLLDLLGHIVIVLNLFRTMRLHRLLEGMQTGPLGTNLGVDLLELLGDLCMLGLNGEFKFGQPGLKFTHFGLIFHGSIRRVTPMKLQICRDSLFNLSCDFFNIDLRQCRPLQTWCGPRIILLPRVISFGLVTGRMLQSINGPG